MSVLDDLGGVINPATSGNASTADVHTAYDRVAEAVPQETLADGISHAFRSDQTPPFEQMLSGLFGQSSPDQKAGLLNRVIGSLGSGGVAQVLGRAGGLAGLGGILSGGQVTREQAQQVSPQEVEVLAREAAKKDPSIMDRAADFYAQHPTLVKALGAGALALLLSKISAARR
jgi:hypothetical protein